MPFKHRVNEGFMNCTDCHNPHGTFQPTWANGARPRHVETAKANEEPCINCHAEKRGPFVFEHAPLRVDGCMACHVPTDRQLADVDGPVVFTLCLECHNGADSFGRTATGAPVPFQFHNLRSPLFQNCTNCHTHIHGSNTSAFFLN